MIDRERNNSNVGFSDIKTRYQGIQCSKDSNWLVSQGIYIIIS